MADAWRRTTNLNALKKQINDLYGMYLRTAASYTFAGYLAYLNDAIRRVVDDFPVFALGTHVLTTVASQRAYDPPPMMELTRLLSVHWSAGNDLNLHTTLNVRSQEWLDANRSTWRHEDIIATPTVLAYDPMENIFRLDPIPASSGLTMDVWYGRRATQFSASAADDDGILQATSVAASGSAVPNGDYAEGGVVTFPNDNNPTLDPHPVYTALSVAPSTAVTVTITGKDSDGNSATEDIVIGTGGAAAHGRKRFYQITGVSWTAAGNATNLTVGDYDQEDADSTHFCDVPDRYINRLLSPAVGGLFAQNDNDPGMMTFFEGIYERNKAAVLVECAPIFDVYSRSLAESSRNIDPGGQYSPL